MFVFKQSNCCNLRSKCYNNNNNNNYYYYYYLRLGRHPVAGVILHITLYMHGL